MQKEDVNVKPAVAPGGDPDGLNGFVAEPPDQRRDTAGTGGTVTEPP
jgi:hypothetical protein